MSNAKLTQYGRVITFPSGHQASIGKSEIEVLAEMLASKLAAMIRGICPQCGEVFFRRDQLNGHMTKHRRRQTITGREELAEVIAEVQEQIGSERRKRLDS